MIEEYLPSQDNENSRTFITVEPDLAAEFPIYIYWPQDKSRLLYSYSITELLNDCRVPKPLQVCNKGVSFLLQSGLVPPPNTVYENIYILGVGDKAKIEIKNDRVEVDFFHNFPFFNAKRLTPEEMCPNEELILNMLAEATISRCDSSRPSFLFHSAGKDSNTIALALADAGWQDNVTLVTHKSKGKADESELSAAIARKLGFKHQVLNEVDKLGYEHKNEMDLYFRNAPFPCTDNVAVAYPLYACQLPALKQSNIIDGGGNDCHMMTPPSVRSKKYWSITKHSHKANFLRNFVRSESSILPLIRTPAEKCGMSGLSFLDSKSILKDAVNVYDFWCNESSIRSNWDLIDFRTDILTTITAAEVHIRKARNFADSINSNLILPFANPNVAKYFALMPESYIFCRETSKNKLILREILKKRVGIDSDMIGKMEYSYDSKKLVVENLSFFVEEICSCKLWNQKHINYLVARLSANIENSSKLLQPSCAVIYRLFTISAWYNRCHYCN